MLCELEDPLESGGIEEFHKYLRCSLHHVENHVHERLLEILLLVISKKQDVEFLGKLVPMPSIEDDTYNSPNVFFMPSKRRRIFLCKN